MFAAILEGLPVGVWVARAPGGEFLYANHQFAEIMGMAARADVARGEYAEPSQKESEARLVRAQRMEAIGTLAGGIAHDFNNLLTVVRSMSSSLIAGEVDPERRDALKMMEEVGERAMHLTRGLLGFAGR